MTKVPIGMRRRMCWTSEAETMAFGWRLGNILHSGDVIAIDGGLGTGKSVLARAAVRGRANDPQLDVPSPTFTLVQVYDFSDGFAIWHADLYRLSGSEECLELGLEEALDGGALILEWPDRLGGLDFGGATLRISLSLGGGETVRDASLVAEPGWETRFESLTTVS